MRGCICSPGPESSSSFLFHADCLEVLGDLPDNSVDCIITDPPYGINYKSLSHSLPKATIANDGPEAYDLLDKALALAVNKLRLNSHVYIFTDWHAYEPMAEVVKRYFNLKNVLVWVKNNRTRGDLKGNYGYQHEMVFYAHKGRRHLVGKRDGNVLNFNKVYSNRMIHPVEKPIKLLEYLIGKSTNEGETVLDPFMGSASTCIAARNLKRNYIGIELDEVWYKVARERLGV
ncbi:MAG TPA: DNA methyltransferase [Ktedonobacteraceae bacterium]|nr:DNA methyltransferase [Ktedonobacteraceae bacterium]